MQLDIPGLVHTVDVSERRCDGEIWRDGGECGIDLVDVFGLSVQGAVVDASVVDTVFLATGNTNFLRIFHQPGAPNTRVGAMDAPFRATASWAQLFEGIVW